MFVLDRSALRTRSGLPYFEVPDLAKIDWIRHAFLTRNGGTSPPPFHSLNLSTAAGDSEERLSENISVIASTFHFKPEGLVLLDQKHRDRILVLKECEERDASDSDYDAVLTDSPDRVLAIKIADCLPILAVDRVKRVIAAIHAGRQGTALQITRKTIRRMGAEFGCFPEDLLIAVGPSIGVCCYEIDEKVFVPEWESFAVPKKNGKWMIDLAGINMDQMRKEGIREDQISWIDLCTRCHPDLFFSYRGEGLTGRQLSFIGIKQTDK